MKDTAFRWLITIIIWFAGIGIYNTIKTIIREIKARRKKETDVDEYPVKLFVALYAGFNRTTNQTTSRTSTIVATDLACAQYMAGNTLKELFPSEEYVQAEWRVDEVKVTGVEIIATIIDPDIFAEKATFCPLAQEAGVETESVEVPSLAHYELIGV